MKNSTRQAVAARLVADPSIAARGPVKLPNVIGGLFALTLAIVIARPVQADSNTWNCVNDWWNTSSCWSLTVLPTASDDVYVSPVSGTYTLLKIDDVTGDAYANTITVDSSTAVAVTLLQSGGSLTTTTSEYIGQFGTGMFSQGAGTHTVNGDLYLGYGGSGNGTYVLANTGSLSALREWIGNSGTGSFYQTGGTHAVSYLYLGDNAGSSGSYDLSGGILTADFSTVAIYGSGAFTQSGGTHTVTGTLMLGASSGSSGTYTLSGTGSLTANNEAVGYSGTGSFTQSGGTHTVSSSLTLGGNSGSKGTYTLSGGNLSVAGLEYIGYFGSGSFTQYGGRNTGNTTLVLGFDTTSQGNYDLSGSSSVLDASNEHIGYSGTGSFTQSGGTHTVSGFISLGTQSGSSGSYSLSGSGSVSANDEYIGLYGTGTFTQSGGTHAVTNTLSVGGNSGSSGSYILSGSGSVSADKEYVGLYGTGAFTQSGGTNTVTNDLSVAGSDPSSSGTYTLSGGSLMANNEYISITGAFTQSSGTNTVSTNFTSRGNYVLSGGILNIGSDLQNRSNATFNFDGGELTVNNRVVNESTFNMGTGTTATVLGTGFWNYYGLLKGTGTIAGNVTSDGTVSPGNSSGTLSVIGNYTQSAAGSLDIQLGGLLAGTEYDVLNVSGTATLDGALDVSLFDLGGGLFDPQLGDSFDILTANLIQGDFSTLILAALDPGLTWDISYLTDAIGSTDVVRLSVVNAVPIPPAVWLFASGLLGLIGVARRKAA